MFQFIILYPYLDTADDVPNLVGSFLAKQLIWAIKIPWGYMDM